MTGGNRPVPGWSGAAALPRTRPVPPAGGGWMRSHRSEINLLAVLVAGMVVAFMARSARPGIAVVMGFVFLHVAFTRLPLAIGLVMLSQIAPPLIPSSSLLGIPGLNPDSIMLGILIVAAWIRGSRAAAARAKPGAPRSGSRNPLLAPLIAFIAVTVMSAFRSPVVVGLQLQDTLTAAKTYLMFTALVFVICYGLESRAEARTVFVGCLVVLGFMTSFAMRDVALHLGNPRFRLDTFVGQANEFGGLLAIVTPFVVTSVLVPDVPKKRRILLVALLVTCCISLMYTMSRGAMLGVVAGLLVIGAIYSRKFLLVVALAAATATWWLPERVIDRFEETTERSAETEYGVDSSTAVRIQQWDNLPELIGDRLLFGHGFDSFPRVNRALTGSNFKAAHSSWIRILVEEGVIGLLAVGWIFATLAVIAYRVMRRGQDFLCRAMGPGMLAAIAVSLVVNISGARFHNAVTNSFFWAFTGILLVCHRELSLPGQAGPSTGLRPPRGASTAGFFTRPAAGGAGGNGAPRG